MKKHQLPVYNLLLHFITTLGTHLVCIFRALTTKRQRHIGNQRIEGRKGTFWSSKIHIYQHFINPMKVESKTFNGSFRQDCDPPKKGDCLWNGSLLMISEDQVSSSVSFRSEIGTN